jgi:hypothetical protein
MHRDHICFDILRVLTDEHVGHGFTMKDGLIQRMEVCASPAADRNT